METLDGRYGIRASTTRFPFLLLQVYVGRPARAGGRAGALAFPSARSVSVINAVKHEQKR